MFVRGQKLCLCPFVFGLAKKDQGRLDCFGMKQPGIYAYDFTVGKLIPNGVLTKTSVQLIDLRRSRKLTHFCSVRLTHLKNKMSV